jgi:hypothetical protein
MRELMEFVVEEGVDGVEVGYDGICIDGEFPRTAVFGYEAKDAAYIGKVVPYDKLAEPLKEVNRKLVPVLRAFGCRSAYSTELRITKRGLGYLIDPCMRFGSPPSECLWLLYENWDEIILQGANGTIVEPKVRGKFAAEVMLKSEWAAENFLALKVSEWARPSVHLYNHCRIGDTDWVVPGITQVGAACGVGDTMQEAVEAALASAEAVQGHELVYDKSAFDTLSEVVERGAKEGIEW